jgi:hypothetical protein
LRSRPPISLVGPIVLAAALSAGGNVRAAPARDDGDAPLTDIPDPDEPATPKTPPRRPAGRPPADVPPAPIVTNPPPAWYQPLRPEDQGSETAAPSGAPERPVSQRRDREDPRRRAAAPGTQPAPGAATSTDQGPAPIAGSTPAVVIPRQRPTLPPYVTTSAAPLREPALQMDGRPDPATAETRRLHAASPPSKSNIGELIRGSQPNLNFYEMVDEMIDEFVYQLSKQDPAALSPMAVRLVRLSPELRPEFAGTLEARLISRINDATTIRTAVCIECTSMRSRVENGRWLLTLGAVRTEDLQRIGRQQGIKTFVDLTFTYSPGSSMIWMEAVAFRASDGGVVWTQAARSDGTTAMLLRTGRRPPSRSERLDELEHKLQGRPYYGYMVGVGLARIGYNGPTGDIQGPMATIRIHERFGDGQSQLFGLSVGIFFTGAPEAGKNVLNSLMSGGYYSFNLSEPTLNGPEVWFYGELGGMFSGNQGNTFYGETGIDLHLKWRFSMVGGLQYVMPTHFANYDLGGVGYRLRLALNW